MKFCEVRDKLEDQALAQKHSIFLAGNQGNLRKEIFAQANLRKKLCDHATTRFGCVGSTPWT
jgi:hypothetical protein